jgi:hypothetical protein
LLGDPALELLDPALEDRQVVAQLLLVLRDLLKLPAVV